jgi:hypothetical protein
MPGRLSEPCERSSRHSDSACRHFERASRCSDGASRHFESASRCSGSASRQSDSASRHSGRHSRYSDRTSRNTETYVGTFQQDLSVYREALSVRRQALREDRDVLSSLLDVISACVDVISPCYDVLREYREALLEYREALSEHGEALSALREDPSAHRDVLSFFCAAPCARPADVSAQDEDTRPWLSVTSESPEMGSVFRGVLSEAPQESRCSLGGDRDIDTPTQVAKPPFFVLEAPRRISRHLPRGCVLTSLHTSAPVPTWWADDFWQARASS